LRRSLVSDKIIIAKFDFENSSHNKDLQLGLVGYELWYKYFFIGLVVGFSILQLHISLTWKSI